jgi:hypothetical protein
VDLFTNNNNELASLSLFAQTSQEKEEEEAADKGGEDEIIN